MANILKIALCPAPFQKTKKKGDKRKDRTSSTSDRSTAIHQHVLPETLIPSLVDLHSSRPRTRSNSSGSPHTTTPTTSPYLKPANSHQNDLPTAGPCQGQCSCNSSCGSGCSRVTQSSGYVTDSNGDHGSFETQMLARATKERPANLRMTVIRDYTPVCNEELSVRKGQRVRVMYRNHDWLFAITKHGHSGFIPFSYVRPSKKYSAGYQSEPEITRIDDSYMSGYDTDVMSVSSRFPFPPAPRPIAANRRHQRPDVPPAYSINTSCRRVGSGSPIQAQVDVFDSGYMSAIEGPTYHSHSSVVSSRYRPSAIKPSVHSFDRSFIEELVVIHSFDGKEENEVTVVKGEKVKVLNANDPEWLWVSTTTSKLVEGFIPRTCCTLGNHPSLSTSYSSRSGGYSRQTDQGLPRRQHPAHHYAHHHQRYRNMRNQAKDRFRQLAIARDTADPSKMSKEEIKRIGTKLIVLMDYEAVSSDELSVEFAETLFADVLSQSGVERIWVYSPRLDSCGYVPMSMVVPPVV